MIGMLWGLLTRCSVVMASHGPLRAPHGGDVLLLGLGVAALRLGLTGADTGFLAGLFLLWFRDILHGLSLCCLQGLLDQSQHELPLGQLPASALGLTLQVGLILLSFPTPSQRVKDIFRGSTGVEIQPKTERSHHAEHHHHHGPPVR